MKITDVKVVPVNKFLFVKVMTDEGITGLGESGDWGFLESSAEVINSFREYLIDHALHRRGVLALPFSRLHQRQLRLGRVVLVLHARRLGLHISAHGA